MTDPSQAAADAAAVLKQAGFQVLFAGGCVRDRLRGVEPKDFDLATDARPDDVLALFPRARAVGAHFGVVLASHRGHDFEIATFRGDGPYRDGRRPESVTFATPVEDARRRDFTVNGLFQDPFTSRIIDHVGGQADLAARLLRAIGNPAARFAEDHLRLLRAVRFATVLEGFRIEPATWAALQALAPQVAGVAAERVRAELSLIWRSPRRQAGFDLLVDSGLMAQILPEVLALRGCEQPPQWHPEGDVFTHTRMMLGLLAADAPETLVWAVLLHDIAKPATATVDPDGRIRFSGHDRVGAEMAGSILRRLRFPNDFIAEVEEMVARHMAFMHVSQMRAAKLRRFMARPTFANELELHRLDCAASNGFTDNYEFLLAKQIEFANEPLLPPPLLNGHDLVALGFPPGPALGRLLGEIQTLQLEGALPDRAAALAWAAARKP
jgi:putative nucleotidyltransferase with HDIG domain